MDIVALANKSFSQLLGFFFNSVDKRFFVISGNEAHFCYESSWIMEFLLSEIPLEKIKFACVSPNNAFFVYQNIGGEVVRVK